MDSSPDDREHTRIVTNIAGAMTNLPETGFLRLSQIIGDPRANPPIPPIIPVKKSCWWDGVRKGRFPRPIKLGPKITVWRVEEIRDLIAKP